MKLHSYNVYITLHGDLELNKGAGLEISRSCIQLRFATKISLASVVRCCCYWCRFVCVVSDCLFLGNAT